MNVIFENSGEIDPRLILLIGANVKKSPSAIGYFGTGLKYAVACLARWGEELTVQSGLAEFTFACEHEQIRGKQFGVLVMQGVSDSLRLGFTTELGKNWEPWMVYRELWCNAHDEPEGRVYENYRKPAPRVGVTRIIVSGPKISVAHAKRAEFILQSTTPLCVVPGLEIFSGESQRIFYRGIAVQALAKPAKYTYNITEVMYLTEDRTVGSWQTDPIIARGLAMVEDTTIIDATLTAELGWFESRLDYDYVRTPGDTWKERAEGFVKSSARDVPASVRNKFIEKTVVTCPTCNRPM